MRQSALVTCLMVACVGVMVAAPPLHAQVGYESPKGHVEVLGLRRWTLTMLQDSIRHYVRGQELHDAACMATLRDSLHFVEASVNQFHMNPPGQPESWFLSIKVVEPEQAASVQWDTRPRNEYSSLLPDYAPFILPVTDSTGVVRRGRLQNWLQESDSARRQLILAALPPASRADAQRVYSFVDGHRAEADRVRAVRVLARDGVWVNRLTAVAVLSSFAANDSTWWVLTNALRDPHETVRSTAAMVLNAMPARPIDWRGSTADLRLLLGGTNLPAIETVFRMLARTDVSPDLARALLHDNAAWVLDHLGAQTPMSSDAAHSLLVRLNGGTDLGRTRAAWAAWTNAL